jgi:hypothetical protein
MLLEKSHTAQCIKRRTSISIRFYKKPQADLSRSERYRRDQPAHP